MPYYVRDIKEGQRFILKRTGEIYTKLPMKEDQGKIYHCCIAKGETKISTLSHSCVVLPIFKASEIKKAAIDYERKENAQKMLREFKANYEISQL